MTVVSTGNGHRLIVDDDDADLVSGYKWTAVKWGRSLYATTATWDRTERKLSHVLVHRMILGITDSTVHIDHINGNPLDNRKQNLRIVTRSQNLANSRLRDDNTSGYKGVTWHKRISKWQAKVSKDNVRHHLGYFATPEDAATAYNRGALRFHGEYARLNTVQG